MKKPPADKFCGNPLCEARLKPDKKSDTCDRECSRTWSTLRKAAKLLFPFGERMAVKVIVGLIRQSV